MNARTIGGQAMKKACSLRWLLAAMVLFVHKLVAAQGDAHGTQAVSGDAAAVSPRASLPASQALDYALKTQWAGLSDDNRDLGLRGSADTQVLYADLTPWLRYQPSPDWAALLRAEAFLSTGNVLQNSGSSGANTVTDSYVRLREAWIEYRGLTNYPGESLRFGRQRIREDDGLWINDDVDAVRWVFDSSLLHADLGIAEQLSAYRSDDVEVPAEQRDRTYVFAHAGWEFLPHREFGLRIVHANDHTTLPGVGAPTQSGDKLDDSRLTWLGWYANGDFYSGSRYSARWAYWAEANWLGGSQTQALTDARATVTSLARHNLSSFAADAGLRWRLPGPWPLQLGVAYAYGEGGSQDGVSRQYQQSGLQNNYSRFTGTPSFLNRFNEAYRAELGNLQVYTGFVSLNLPRDDASLVYQHFHRNNAQAGIVSGGVSVAPGTADSDLGDGLDVVATHYFDFGGSAHADDALGELARASIRLRASAFFPGAAYGAAAADRYRVILEATLWF